MLDFHRWKKKHDFFAQNFCRPADFCVARQKLKHFIFVSSDTKFGRTTQNLVLRRKSVMSDDKKIVFRVNSPCALQNAATALLSPNAVIFLQLIRVQ
jgi:hypothetical protein